MLELTEHLEKYICEKSAPILTKWIIDTKCQFIISKSRLTKLGDYRAPFHGQPHRITVNHNLNKYAFLLTSIHEFAHLKTYNEYKNKIAPHGPEWKKNFQLLMHPFLTTDFFPKDLLVLLKKHIKNPKASSNSDVELHRAFKKYDPQKYGFTTVEKIAEGKHFALPNGRVFMKKEKLRKRFKCTEIKTQRTYLFQPLAEVKKI